VSAADASPARVATYGHEPARLPVLATRAECSTVPRPCGFILCKYNLKPERRGPVPAEAPSCALDVADAGGVTLEAIGGMLGVTRERIRQIEGRALRHFGERIRALGLDVLPPAIGPR
jgi:hypothetical protein